MGSTRLPGKSLKTILDKPMLFYGIERLKKTGIPIIVATTKEKSDDDIEKFCLSEGIACFRGDTLNVLERYFKAASSFNAKTVIRITGDCPLVDPNIVVQVLNFYLTHSYDYVSNTLERTYPRGMDIEIFSFAALEKAYTNAKATFEKEHVTPHLYLRPKEFKIHNIKNPVDESVYRLTVDTNEDFELVKQIIENLYPQNPDFKLKDIVDLLKIHPEMASINSEVRQKELNQ